MSAYQGMRQKVGEESLISNELSLFRTEGTSSGGPRTEYRRLGRGSAQISRKDSFRTLTQSPWPEGLIHVEDDHDHGRRTLARQNIAPL